MDIRSSFLLRAEQQLDGGLTFEQEYHVLREKYDAPNRLLTDINRVTLTPRPMINNNIIPKSIINPLPLINY